MAAGPGDTGQGDTGPGDTGPGGAGPGGAGPGGAGPGGAGPGGAVARGLRVAVMQPYFFPYAGYYRLMAAADLFVILDCVQFARRGRVHRCEVPGPSGRSEWLTLPLARQPRAVRIRDLAFAPDAGAEFARRLARHRWACAPRPPEAEALARTLRIGTASVTDHLHAQLTQTARVLGLGAGILHSSALGLADDLHGQDRIIAIARAVGARVYVNAPGGRALYDPAAFARAGLGLAFLPPWQGAPHSVLPDLLAGQTAPLRAAILDQSRTEPG
jgi:hypothetical protein